jgi:cobalamin biosynthesis protein CobD/CbiB
VDTKSSRKHTFRGGFSIPYWDIAIHPVSGHGRVVTSVTENDALEVEDREVVRIWGLTALILKLLMTHFTKSLSFSKI